MSDELRDQIYNNMNMKDTDELLEIWQTNNRYEWTDMAFDVIRQILQKRIGELPEQNEPVYEEEAEGDREDENEEDTQVQEAETPELADPDDGDLACPRCRSTEVVQ